MDVAPDLRSVTGRETVTFTPDQPICELVFRAWPNAPSPAGEGNALQVTDASVGGRPTAPVVRPAGATAGAPGTLVELPLPACVAPGEVVRAELGFTAAPRRRRRRAPRHLPRHRHRVVRLGVPDARLGPRAGLGPRRRRAHPRRDRGQRGLPARRAARHRPGGRSGLGRRTRRSPGPGPARRHHDPRLPGRRRPRRLRRRRRLPRPRARHRGHAAAPVHTGERHPHRPGAVGRRARRRGPPAAGPVRPVPVPGPVGGDRPLADVGPRVPRGAAVRRHPAAGARGAGRPRARPPVVLRAGGQRPGPRPVDRRGLRDLRPGRRHRHRGRLRPRRRPRAPARAPRRPDGRLGRTAASGRYNVGVYTQGAAALSPRASRRARNASTRPCGPTSPRTPTASSPPATWPAASPTCPP